MSIEPAEEGRKLLERVTRDCQEDRPHVSLTPYPLRLLTDPEVKLIRAVGAENQGHWARHHCGPDHLCCRCRRHCEMVYISASAADRPSLVALAKAAVSIAKGKAPPAEYPRKAEG